MLRIAEHFHDSDLGRQRQGNEDNYFVRAPLFVVADGMGGAQAGEVASELAVKQFERGLPDGRPTGEALAELIRQANAEIHRQSGDDPDLAGMGTTVTAAYLDGDNVVVAHVGDSRAYLLRDGDLIRLTRDHSLVGELVARGKLTEEQAETHPQRSVITRALGAYPTSRSTPTSTRRAPATCSCSAPTASPAWSTSRCSSRCSRTAAARSSRPAAR